jgi:predicted ABC-type ATPase
VAPALLHGALAVDEFINADVIAHGLSAFDPEGVAIAAGRVMITRMRTLAQRRVNFAFETTLASRSFAPWLRDLCSSGYAVHLVFLWLSSADLAVQRVAARVAAGGHSVPENTIRRRYRTGMRNFVALYQPLVSSWALYNASGPDLTLVAEAIESQPIRVYDSTVWAVAQRQTIE